MKYKVNDEVKIEINDDILKFLGNNNVNLSELNNSDRVYLLYLLKQYYLRLRSRLGLEENITLGLEIEFEESLNDLIEEELDNACSSGDWSMVPDGSLFNGAEINSPVLRDDEKSWIDLSCVCDIVNRYAFVMENTSAHIHIGIQILGNNPKYWANFAKLWAAYENVIFRFLYGEYVSPRDGILEYARPISKDFINNLQRIDERSKMISSMHMFKIFDPGDENIKLRRRKSVNFTNLSNLQPYMYNYEGKKNTVEFRSPNGTFNPVIWQNNVNFLTKLLLYCKSNQFDETKILNRINQVKNDNIASNLYKYSYVYLEQALELSDMIFDNNLDKVYFLRQYIKNGEVSNKPLVKSKTFTRR